MKNGCLHWILNVTIFFLFCEGCSKAKSVEEKNHNLAALVVGGLLLGVSSYLYREPKKPNEGSYSGFS